MNFSPASWIDMKAISALLCWSLLVVASASEKDEPLLGYTLQIDGKEVLLEPGKELKIEGKFENPKVKLLPNQTRLFSAAGVVFKYPAYFTFEADFSTDGIKIWTLSGKDFMVMLHQISANVSAKEIAEGMKTQYGKSSKTSPISRKINGQNLKGVRVTANLAGAGLVQDVLALPTENGSRLLILQDLTEKEKEAESVAETKLATDLLDATLEFEEINSNTH
jgi:hypothetical protein